MGITPFMGSVLDRPMDCALKQPCEQSGEDVSGISLHKFQPFIIYTHMPEKNKPLRWQKARINSGLNLSE